MKNNLIKLYSFLLILSFVSLISCGPSSEGNRENEIRDSLEMEQERKELLDRANKILETNSTETEENRDQSDRVN